MKNLPKKPILVGIVIALAVLLVGGAWWINRPSNDEPEETTKNKTRISLPENVIPVSERPVMRLTPLSSGHHIEFAVDYVKKPAEEVDYTLEYQTGTLVQAEQDLLTLNTLPITKEIFLGSCSAGGACTYHEDIKGGSLLTTFLGDDPYALKSDWKYIDNLEKETDFSSRDGMFQISSQNLSVIRFLIIFNNAGYPDNVPGRVVSNPYSLSASSTLTGTAELNIRAQEEGQLTIAGWDGEAWQTFETTSDGKMASAEVALMPLYVVIVE